MDQQDKEVVQKIAEILNKLAILKNQVRTPEQLVAMATYLSKHFYIKEISKASEYFLQRSPYFPNIDNFFSVLKPVKSIDQLAIEKRAEFIEEMRAYNFDYAKLMAFGRKESLEFVRLVGWDKAQTIYEKDALEIFKGILNKPEFYLGVDIGNAKIEQ